MKLTTAIKEILSNPESRYVLIMKTYSFCMMIIGTITMVLSYRTMAANARLCVVTGLDLTPFVQMMVGFIMLTLGFVGVIKS